MKKKIWIASFNPMLLIGGILIVISVLAFYMNPEFSVLLFFVLLTVLSMISAVNFVIAEEDKITFFTFLFLPHKFRYDEIFTMYHLSHPQKKQYKTLFLYLNNGRRRQVQLGLYQEYKQQEIIDFLSGKIILNEEYYRDRERLVLWLKSARTKKMLNMFIIGSILCCAGIIFQLHTLSWDRKIDQWSKKEAVIEVNHEEKIKLSDTETVSKYQLRYRYVYNGKNYTGNKIAGGAEKLASRIKAGEKMICIVNPDDPEESALLTRYRADWISNFLGFLFLFIGIVINICAVLPWLKKVNIPENLKNYLIGFEPEQIMGLTRQLRGECKISVGKITGSYRIKEDQYGCFPLSHGVFANLILLILFLCTIPGGMYVMPHFFLLSFIILYLIYQNLFPRGAILDHKEKKIYWSRYFSLKSIPDKIKRNDVLNESDLMALGLTLRGDNSLVLFMVRKDGVYVPVVKADLRSMEQLFSDSVKIAEELGKLPIIII